MLLVLHRMLRWAPKTQMLYLIHLDYCAHPKAWPPGVSGRVGNKLSDQLGRGGGASSPSHSGFQGLNKVIVPLNP